MKPLKLSFTTFLKICAKKPRGKIGEIRKFADPGGYDFYKVMKRLAGAMASGNTTFAAAKLEIAKITKKAEREHTLDAIIKLHSWLLTHKGKWVSPPEQNYKSENGLLVIKLAPEIAFKRDDGSIEIIYLWNIASPELSQELAGEGLWLLADEMGKPDNEFKILNVRTTKAYSENIINASSGPQLQKDLMVIEEIWKDIHDPALSSEDTLSHITSLTI